MGTSWIADDCKGMSGRPEGSGESDKVGSPAKWQKPSSPVPGEPT